jgi:hypothetical protein
MFFIKKNQFFDKSCGKLKIQVNLCFRVEVLMFAVTSTLQHKNIKHILIFI